MEDALWQIYSNTYISVPLKLKEDTNKLFRKLIITRAIVFFKTQAVQKGRGEEEEII